MLKQTIASSVSQGLGGGHPKKRFVVSGSPQPKDRRGEMKKREGGGGGVVLLLLLFIIINYYVIIIYYFF